ncbi:MAG: extradiol ring-cleavage dioxygenase [Alphaproteobacteria bacterium]|nr:extradiol ring-cleavage dioxygenase [Alphaproteobacteria bacterium]MBV9860893.1 extradiol ring-cleavage dioxygenase [Alphaproteobacteria bacterium]
MLNAPPEDWPRFLERDSRRQLLDNDGQAASYEELLLRAAPGIAAEIAPERIAGRHGEAQAALARLAEVICRAELDALIVVGDDQDELYHADNLPGFLVYYGDTIRNVPLTGFKGPDWARRASARHFEESAPRDYPVAADLARHLIAELIERDFDVASSAGVPEGRGEGHAFGFVHRRLMTDAVVPVVPVSINTYYPPNQPTPRRCYKLGQAIRAAVESWPEPGRIGILASGGLSHFVVDEALDRGLLDALRRKDAAAVQDTPRAKLNSGSSEMRNWICLGGAVEHLQMGWSRYLPGYRTPAGTGCGLGFAVWS